MKAGNAMFPIRLRRFLVLLAALPGILGSAFAQAETYLPGKIVRADLLTTDLDAAAQFYHSVFGWRMDRIDGDGQVVASINGRRVATLVSYPDGEAPQDGSLWLASISVTDVDDAASRAAVNGGKLLEPATDEPGVGRLAVIQDPAGAVIMLLKANGGDPVDGPVNASEWLWTELWTDQPVRAADFYARVVGYQVGAYKGREGDEFRILGRDGMARASILRTPLPNVVSNWLLYLKVDNIHAAARSVVKHGGSILLPPMKSELNDDVAIVADPTGGVFALQAGGDDS